MKSLLALAAIVSCATASRDRDAKTVTDMRPVAASAWLHCPEDRTSRRPKDALVPKDRIIVVESGSIGRASDLLSESPSRVLTSDELASLTLSLARPDASEVPVLLRGVAMAYADPDERRKMGSDRLEVYSIDGTVDVRWKGYRLDDRGLQPAPVIVFLTSVPRIVFVEASYVFSLDNPSND